MRRLSVLTIVLTSSFHLQAQSVVDTTPPIPSYIGDKWIAEEVNDAIIHCGDSCKIIFTNENQAIKNSIIIKGASKNNSLYLENKGKTEAVGLNAVSGSVILDNSK